MITRLWRGWTRPENAEAYEQFLLRELFPAGASLRLQPARRRLGHFARVSAVTGEETCRMRLDRGMDAIAGSLITAFDYVWGRLTGRLAGLTDDEYFWEPVAGCWSLRQGGDGRWHLDGGGGGGPAPDPVPVTTIAWRLGHLGAMAVGGFASRRFGDGALTTGQIAFAPTAADVTAFLDEHYRNWRSGLTGLTPAEWAAPLGPPWGPYAEDNTVDLALHVLDEVIHHGAEVGLLRDLYSHRSSLHG